MSTEFNYVARLDTSQIMSGLSEIRSQVGMALGGAGGFGGGPLSATNFGGGASAAVEQLVRSMPYGMQGAATTLPQEMAIFGTGGMAAAGRMAPPGVSAGEFAFAAMSNNIDRAIQSREAAAAAGGAAFASSAGGLLAGDLAMGIATPLGVIAGGRAATSMFGAGAAGAGRAIGGLAAGVAAMFGVSEYVGGKIQDHYSDIEQTLGVTRELGDIVGGGRGLSRTQQYDLGVAARDAAKSMKMDFNQMGDIMALSREAGMLPSAVDPQKAKQQIIEYATAIKEASETLHSSFATATQVVKSATKQGLTIEEGTLRARMGTLDGGGGWLSAMQTQVTSGPLGSLQLMAARGGQPLGGIMDLPGQALEAMSQGGDMISNMGKFMVHEHEYRRGMGSKGVRAMAMHQIESMGEVMSDLMPGLSGNEAKRMAAMQMYGMSGEMAQKYISGMTGSGDGGYKRALALAEQTTEGQIGALGSRISRMPAPEERASFGWGYASEGAMIGMIGGPKGAIVGAAGGFAVGNAKALWQAGGDLVDGIGDLFRGSTAAADRRGRSAAEAYDRSEQGIKDKMGYLTVNPEDMSRGMTADLRGVTLDMHRQIGGTVTTRAANMSEAALRIAGLTPVAGGPGTIQFGGGVSFSAVEVQKLANSYGGKALGVKDLRKADDLAYQMFHDPGAASRFAAGESSAAFDELAARGTAWGDMDPATRWKVSVGNQVSLINTQIGVLSGTQDPNSKAFQDAATNFNVEVQTLARGITSEKDRKLFLDDVKSGGMFRENSISRKALAAGGVNIDQLKGIGDRARLTLGAAVGETLAEQREGSIKFISKAIGRPGADDADVRRVAEAALADSEWDDLKKMAARGAGSKEMNETYRAILRRAKVKSGVAGDKDVVDIAGADVHTKMIQKMDGKDIEADLAQNLALDSKKLDRTGLAKRRGPDVHSRTLGFGEQEQAMSAINRSLQRTHGMIEALDKRISGRSGSAPSPSNAAPPSSPSGVFGTNEDER